MKNKNRKLICPCWCMLTPGEEDAINRLYYERTKTHWMRKSEGLKPAEQAVLVCGVPLQTSSDDLEAYGRLRVFIKQEKGFPRCKDCCILIAKMEIKEMEEDIV